MDTGPPSHAAHIIHELPWTCLNSSSFLLRPSIHKPPQLRLGQAQGARNTGSHVDGRGWRGPTHSSEPSPAASQVCQRAGSESKEQGLQQEAQEPLPGGAGSSLGSLGQACHACHSHHTCHTCGSCHSASCTGDRSDQSHPAAGQGGEQARPRLQPNLEPIHPLPSLARCQAVLDLPTRPWDTAHLAKAPLLPCSRLHSPQTPPPSPPPSCPAGWLLPECPLV